MSDDRVAAVMTPSDCSPSCTTGGNFDVTSYSYDPVGSVTAMLSPSATPRTRRIRKDWPRATDTPSITSFNSRCGQLWPTEPNGAKTPIAIRRSCPVNSVASGHAAMGKGEGQDVCVGGCAIGRCTGPKPRGGSNR